MYEPIHRFSLDIAADTFGLVLPVLARLAAIPGAPVPHGSKEYLLHLQLRVVGQHRVAGPRG